MISFIIKMKKRKDTRAILQMPLFYYFEDRIKLSGYLMEMAQNVKNRKPIPYKLNNKFLSYFDTDFYNIPKRIDDINRQELINYNTDEIANKFDGEYGLLTKLLYQI